MPVLHAIREAEALCAQLNREGHVDACITADSDAFLYGAKCVVKRLTPNSKDPFEIYHMSDIEAGLGLKRNHLIAISLLVGNDHDLNGVQGIGVDTAVRFVKAFGEDEILDKLSDIGRGDALTEPTLKENLQSPKPLHCSFCGHPGSKKSHLQFNCEFCDSTLGNGCTPKAIGFKCVCSSCDLGRKKKEVEKKENWHLKICRKIASEHNFPNNEIINILMSNDLDIDDKHLMSWGRPKMDMLVDYLSYHLQWEPSYTRQRMFPMLSTIFLREVASNVPQVQIDNGCCFLCSDEDIELVFEAYPDKVDQFLKEKELKVGNTRNISFRDLDRQRKVLSRQHQMVCS
ncbi:hypothetical protein Leryth_026640 [Lithospermum erythrorhizon]|nr:hypothetical protein Leryth_026640 [Lithospermum erythrorhizon]